VTPDKSAIGPATAAACGAKRMLIAAMLHETTSTPNMLLTVSVAARPKGPATFQLAVWIKVNSEIVRDRCLARTIGASGSAVR
jgi:hypothetical protein